MAAGKPTVMVFWATWCPYCKAFMPYLAEIQRDYGEDSINVVLINHKERGAGDPVAYVDTLDFANLAVMDGDTIGDAHSHRFYPGAADRRCQRHDRVAPGVNGFAGGEDRR
ncbi:MAG: TlpA disulfide reductase family protein [Woeseiaceae bacterium]|nr:TlpA disulfide reductase family protein [Woeseiaceae bacterium]